MSDHKKRNTDTYTTATGVTQTDMRMPDNQEDAKQTRSQTLQLTQEELHGGDHDLGNLGETSRCNHVDRLLIGPDVPLVKLDHNVHGCLHCDPVALLQHGEHEVLQHAVHLAVLVPGVDALDV